MDAKKLSILLNTCAASKSLSHEKLLHQKSITTPSPHPTVCKSIIYFYLFFHHLHLLLPTAQVLHSMQAHTDVTTYNAIIAALSKSHHYHQALHLFHDLRLSTNLKPDNHTYPSTLKVCAALWNTFHGERIHTRVIISGFHRRKLLVAMYAKCGRFTTAIKVFDEMPEKDVACWNNVISCYYQSGHPSKYLELFEEMRRSGFEPDSVTFTIVFSVCARVSDLTTGRKVHEDLIRTGVELDGFVGAAIVDMYEKYGYVESGREVFEQIPVKSVVSWNSMIGGFDYYEQGRSDADFDYYEQIREENDLLFKEKIEVQRL